MRALTDYFVLGFLALLGVGVIWMIGRRLWPARSGEAGGDPETAAPLGEGDIRRIEAALGVVLPGDYAACLRSARVADGIDETTVSRDVELIVARTREHRAGHGGAPGWPAQFVYIGDEDDACPYALDCASGQLVRTDHGDLTKRPLQRYASFSAFVEAMTDEDGTRL